ncbi:hypothetical protein UFOVP847_10 [uncultured Caudovirales phage]|uniref:Uncharacterized protein n=1 Tax=uncultured Caudovirales phage TaxID=2100421 RepID=A0A6J5PEN4_9CAUD|nr:hypothetical protein UFOVP847_10 [uncultured Caudovirales phage]
MMEKLTEAMKLINDLNRTHGIVQRGGKKYTEVSVRIEAFRQVFGTELGINTMVLVDDGKRVVVKAMISTANDHVIGSGMAEEIRGSSNVNKTSALENCETSAIGRALAAIGLHGGTYASANEIAAVGRKEEAQRAAPAEPKEDPFGLPPATYQIFTHTGAPYKGPSESLTFQAGALVELMKVYAKTDKDREGNPVPIRNRMTMIRELKEANTPGLLAVLSSEAAKHFDEIYKKILAALGAKMNEEDEQDEDEGN